MLNVGLQAGVLDTRTFSMFVVHAIFLTFMTTPLTLLFYPSKYRNTGSNAAKHIRGAEVEGGAPHQLSSEDEIKTRFALVLDKMEQLSAAMTFSQLLQSPAATSTNTLAYAEQDEKAVVPSSPGFSSPINIDTLRLIELTNRTSAVLKSQEAESLIYNDPIVSIFRTFGYLNRLFVSAALSVVPFDEFPTAIANHVKESNSQMVILPWSRGVTSVLEEGHSDNKSVRNPFDGVFHKTTTHDQTSSVVYSEYIRRVFLSSPTDVALFVDRGLSLQYTGQVEHHFFLPFFGGPDDRLALNFLIQLCGNPLVSALVVKINKTEMNLTPTSSGEEEKDTAVGVASPRLPHHVSFTSSSR